MAHAQPHPTYGQVGVAVHWQEQSQLQHLQTNDSAEGRGAQDVYVTFVIKSIALQRQSGGRAAAAQRRQQCTHAKSCSCSDGGGRRGFFGASSCLLVTLQQKDTTVDRDGEGRGEGVVQMARRDSRRGQSRAHSNKAWRRAQWFFGPGVAVCQVGCGRSHSAHSELKRSSSAANPTEQPKFPRVCQNQSRFYRKSFTILSTFTCPTQAVTCFR